MKKRVNKIFKIDLINNTTTCPQIRVNGYEIPYIGSTLQYYCKDIPTYNDRLSAVVHAMQSDEYQITSTLQANMKVSTLNKEARRGYKFPTLTQNLLSFPVLAENRCKITLDRTSIKVTKIIKQVMAGYR